MSYRLPDGGGWSPDGGSFWVQGELVYWADGDITKQDMHNIFRTLDYGRPEGDGTENYSKWTPEHRAKVRAETARLREEYIKKEAERMATRCPCCGQLPEE